MRGWGPRTSFQQRLSLPLPLLFSVSLALPKMCRYYKDQAKKDERNKLQTQRVNYRRQLEAQARDCAGGSP